MRFGINIRIYPKRHWRNNPQLFCKPVNSIQFITDFNIKQRMPTLVPLKFHLHAYQRLKKRFFQHLHLPQ